MKSTKLFRLILKSTRANNKKFVIIITGQNPNAIDFIRKLHSIKIKPILLFLEKNENVKST